jgi:FkbH-like protein
LLREADRLTPEEIDQRATAIVGLMRRFLGELREYTDVPFLVHNASGLPLARARRLLPLLAPLSRGRRQVVEALNAAIAQIVENTPHALLIDEMAVAQAQGHREAAKPAVQHARNAQFHTARFGQGLAMTYADTLASMHRMRRTKVIAVDFDNTLWHGVMADGDVVHHGDRQQLLRKAKEGGILLVAVSKNDPKNVRWEEMRLQPEDFVLHKIGWGLKVESIAAAARELDLGLDSFAFVDDNDAECEFVRTQLPAVQVWNSNDAFTWRSFERLLRLPNVTPTAEARNRTELYRQQAMRKEALSTSFDYPEMMASLALAVEFRRMMARDLDRVTELVQRTNQFNTTTKRYSRQELQGFAQSDRHRVYVASLADKFGTLGLVLVAIVELRDDEAVIDSFIMSCRAMGFQLEQTALRLMVGSEADRRWRGLFVASDRNTPASTLYSDCGFAASDGDWVLTDPSRLPDVPRWFTVRSTV